MATKQFKAESKRLLEMMINSIYTHKEIFLRELISNASDAIDKSYYKSLTDQNISFHAEDFYISISADKENRILTIKDTGIGMSKEELEGNLGTIAKSGSLAFKQQNEAKDGVDIIGQFGVGFYSAFMVAESVTVISKPMLGENAEELSAHKWESKGAEGYTIVPTEKEDHGTEIILKIKANTEDENYDEFLEEYRIKGLVKKYSDFIKYPIKMGEDTINSMVPIWRKNKAELKEEDYNEFYQEKHFGFDKPLKHIHASVDGVTSYNAILYIPSKAPFDFYTKEFEKGLELYSNGVMIMHKCPDLLPDYFSFVQGLVDSADLSLNISRELLQHDRQLQFIAKKIKEKIKSELLSMQKNDREKYVEFFRNFGRTIKYGVYSEWGSNKEMLQDLLMFHSSAEKALVTLEEYVSRMKEDQKYIYYATGDTVEKIARLPQTEMVADKGYEILYLTDEIDEFAVKMLMNFKEKEFRSVAGGDLGFEAETPEKEETKEEQDENTAIFEKMKEALGDRVKEVRASKILKSHPVCLTSSGELSIEMEKVLSMMPEGSGAKAEKVLEINTNHEIYQSVKAAYKNDEEKFKLFASVLFNQAMLIEGLSIEDPVQYANDVCKLLK